MKNFSLVALIFMGLNSFAQITITESDFPDGGDTALVSISTDFDFDFATTGGDLVWDFSALTMSTQRVDTFFDVSDASVTYQLVFNNGWLYPDYEAEYYTNLVNFAIPSTDIIGVSIEKPVGFTKVESDRVEIVGIGLEISGAEVPIKNEIIDVEYELPLDFGDNWTSDSFFEIDLNPAYDGILRRHQERISQVDGYGEITTPFGTFEALRTVAYLDFTDSLKVTVAGIETWVELPTPNQTIYSWWADNQKIPVLQVVVQDILGTETVTSVEYKDSYLGDVSLEENTDFGFELFPNPSSSLVQISLNAPIDKIEIINVMGKKVNTYEWNSQTKQLAISNLAKGIYFVRIVSNNSILTKQLLVE